MLRPRQCFPMACVQYIRNRSSLASFSLSSATVCQRPDTVSEIPIGHSLAHTGPLSSNVSPGCCSTAENALSNCTRQLFGSTLPATAPLPHVVPHVTTAVPTVGLASAVWTPVSATLQQTPQQSTDGAGRSSYPSVQLKLLSLHHRLTVSFNEQFSHHMNSIIRVLHQANAVSASPVFQYALDSLRALRFQFCQLGGICVAYGEYQRSVRGDDNAMLPTVYCLHSSIRAMMDLVSTFSAKIREMSQWLHEDTSMTITERGLGLSSKFCQFVPVFRRQLMCFEKCLQMVVPHLSTNNNSMLSSSESSLVHYAESSPATSDNTACPISDVVTESDVLSQLQDGEEVELSAHGVKPIVVAPLPIVIEPVGQSDNDRGLIEVKQEPVAVDGKISRTWCTELICVEDDDGDHDVTASAAADESTLSTSLLSVEKLSAPNVLPCCNHSDSTSGDGRFEMSPLFLSTNDFSSNGMPSSGAAELLPPEVVSFCSSDVSNSVTRCTESPVMFSSQPTVCSVVTTCTLSQWSTSKPLPNLMSRSNTVSTTQSCETAVTDLAGLLSTSAGEDVVCRQGPGTEAASCAAAAATPYVNNCAVTGTVSEDHIDTNFLWSSNATTDSCAKISHDLQNSYPQSSAKGVHYLQHGEDHFTCSNASTLFDQCVSNVVLQDVASLSVDTDSGNLLSISGVFSGKQCAPADSNNELDPDGVPNATTAESHGGSKMTELCVADTSNDIFNFNNFCTISSVRSVKLERFDFADTSEGSIDDIVTAVRAFDENANVIFNNVDIFCRDVRPQNSEPCRSFQAESVARKKRRVPASQLAKKQKQSSSKKNSVSELHLEAAESSSIYDEHSEQNKNDDSSRVVAEPFFADAVQSKALVAKSHVADVQETLPFTNNDAGQYLASAEDDSVMQQPLIVKTFQETDLTESTDISSCPQNDSSGAGNRNSTVITGSVGDRCHDSTSMTFEEHEVEPAEEKCSKQSRSESQDKADPLCDEENLHVSSRKKRSRERTDISSCPQNDSSGAGNRNSTVITGTVGDSCHDSTSMTFEEHEVEPAEEKCSKQSRSESQDKADPLCDEEKLHVSSRKKRSHESTDISSCPQNDSSGAGNRKSTVITGSVGDSCHDSTSMTFKEHEVEPAEEKCSKQSRSESQDKADPLCDEEKLHISSRKKRSRVVYDEEDDEAEMSRTRISVSQRKGQCSSQTSLSGNHVKKTNKLSGSKGKNVQRKLKENVVLKEKRRKKKAKQQKPLMREHSSERDPSFDKHAVKKALHNFSIADDNCSAIRKHKLKKSRKLLKRGVKQKSVCQRDGPEASRKIIADASANKPHVKHQTLCNLPKLHAVSNDQVTPQSSNNAMVTCCLQMSDMKDQPKMSARDKVNAIFRSSEFTRLNGVRSLVHSKAHKPAMPPRSQSSSEIADSQSGIHDKLAFSPQKRGKILSADSKHHAPKSSVTDTTVNASAVCRMRQPVSKRPEEHSSSAITSVARSDVAARSVNSSSSWSCSRQRSHSSTLQVSKTNACEANLLSLASSPPVVSSHTVGAQKTVRSTSLNLTSSVPKSTTNVSAVSHSMTGSKPLNMPHATATTALLDPRLSHKQCSTFSNQRPMSELSCYTEADNPSTSKASAISVPNPSEVMHWPWEQSHHVSLSSHSTDLSPAGKNKPPVNDSMNRSWVWDPYKNSHSFSSVDVGCILSELDTSCSTAECFQNTNPSNQWHSAGRVFHSGTILSPPLPTGDEDYQTQSISRMTKSDFAANEGTSVSPLENISDDTFDNCANTKTLLSSNDCVQWRLIPLDYSGISLVHSSSLSGDERIPRPVNRSVNVDSGPVTVDWDSDSVSVTQTDPRRKATNMEPFGSSTVRREKSDEVLLADQNSDFGSPQTPNFLPAVDSLDCRIQKLVSQPDLFPVDKQIADQVDKMMSWWEVNSEEEEKGLNVSLDSGNLQQFVEDNDSDVDQFIVIDHDGDSNDGLVIDLGAADGDVKPSPSNGENEFVEYCKNDMHKHSTAKELVQTAAFESSSSYSSSACQNSLKMSEAYQHSNNAAEVKPNRSVSLKVSGSNSETDTNASNVSATIVTSNSREEFSPSNVSKQNLSKKDHSMSGRGSVKARYRLQGACVDRANIVSTCLSCLSDVSESELGKLKRQMEGKLRAVEKKLTQSGQYACILNDLSEADKRQLVLDQLAEPAIVSEFSTELRLQSLQREIDKVEAMKMSIKSQFNPTCPSISLEMKYDHYDRACINLHVRKDWSYVRMNRLHRYHKSQFLLTLPDDLRFRSEHGKSLSVEGVPLLLSEFTIPRDRCTRLAALLVLIRRLHGSPRSPLPVDVLRKLGWLHRERKAVLFEVCCSTPPKILQAVECLSEKLTVYKYATLNVNY